MVSRISKKQKYIIISIILTLIIHAAFLYFLCTYKPSHHEISFPHEMKKEYIMITLDEPDTANQLSTSAQDAQEEKAQEEQKLQPPRPAEEKKQTPSSTTHLNPFSNKDAEVMDGPAITQAQTGAPQWAPGMVQDSEQENGDPETEEQEDLSENEESENQKGDTASSEDDPDQTTRSEEDGSEDQKGFNDGGSEKVIPESLTTEPLTGTHASLTNRPIISRKSQTQAQKKLTVFSHGFNKQFDKNREEKSRNRAKQRVAQHQSELQTMSYRQKLNQAIYGAALRAPEVYADHAINEKIKILIELDPQGKIITCDFVQKTSLPAVNAYIMNLIGNATFPPLPKHLNLSSWSHVFDPLVRIQKGRYRLVYQYRE